MPARAMHPADETLDLRQVARSVLLRVKVVPGASRTRIAGLWNGALRVQLAAPPQQGKANRELVRFLARTLGCQPAQIEITGGRTHPLKQLRVAGLTAAKVRERLLGPT